MRTAPCPIECRRRAGVYTIEFALVLLVFLTLMFSMLEVARIVYLYATLIDASARAAAAAAGTDFSDPAALDAVRAQAMPQGADGRLLLGGALGPEYLRIEYLNAANASVSLPCPAENLLRCAADPLGSDCIRTVRVRVCEPGTDCTPARYRPLLGIGTLALLVDLHLPTFDSTAPATTLGYVPGAAGSCP